MKLAQVTEAEIIRRVQDISTLAASNDFEAAAVLKAQLYRDFIEMCAGYDNISGQTAETVLGAIAKFAAHIKTLDLIVFPAKEQGMVPKGCTGTLLHGEFTECPVHDK